MDVTTTTACGCRRCGRTDLPILSNGYCTRCDDAVYGYHAPVPAAPFGWPEPGPIVILEKPEVG